MARKSRWKIVQVGGGYAVEGPSCRFGPWADYPDKGLEKARQVMRSMGEDPDAVPLVKLVKVEAGLYEVPDGSYGVVKVESVGEWDEVSQGGWAIVQERRPGYGSAAKDGNELPGAYGSKKEAHQELSKMLAPKEEEA